MQAFVVKPAVSCGGKDTARYDIDQGQGLRSRSAASCTAMLDHGATLSRRDRTEAAKSSLMSIIGSRYSHAVRRGAVLNDQTSPKVEIEYAPDVRPHEASPAERLLGDRVMAHIPGGSRTLLYARIDLISRSAGIPMLLEAELTEPTLFLEFSQDGVERLAECIVAALGP